MPDLPVHEMFYSFQGEGVHLGRAAFFVRLYGCPLHCPWCDSAGTWHPDHVPQAIQRLPAQEIARLAKESGATICIVTGGEPCIHDLTELANHLLVAGVIPHLETSGAFPISGTWGWITLSPKWGKLPLAESWSKAHELKVIVEDSSSILAWEGAIPLASLRKGIPIWLHPEWSKRTDFEVLQAITSAVKNHPRTYRAGWQLHKLYQADAFDPRSQRPVPLGGDPRRGL